MLIAASAGCIYVIDRIDDTAKGGRRIKFRNDSLFLATDFICLKSCFDSNFSISLSYGTGTYAVNSSGNM